jgi:hypothetical protein
MDGARFKFLPAAQDDFSHILVSHYQPWPFGWHSDLLSWFVSVAIGHR